MPNGDLTVSALLPVHAGVANTHLEQALEGLLSQTRLPDEVIVVHDGGLSSAQEALLSGLDARHPSVVHVRLPVNRGAGVANQAGLVTATGEWIAKFDADDVCRPDRLERQLAAVAERQLDVCGSAMLEFEDDPSSPVAIRRSPLDENAIRDRMRTNNPINHPTSFYRRELALAVGGYADLRYMQDYDLFARLMIGGARMENLADPLVLFRADADMRRRRSARALLVLEWRLQQRLRGYGLFGWPRMLANLASRLGFRILPGPLMRVAYRRFLSRPLRHDHEKPGDEDMRVTWDMVRNQARLGTRSVRDLARDPRRARGFRRLVASRGRSTMRLRLPWLPYPLIDELAGWVGAVTRVFEYGGGGSTLWFLDRGATVVTVEHHPGWAEHLRQQAAGPRWTLLERDLDNEAKDYVGAIEAYPDESFDLVVVDGRERGRCTLAALDKVRPGGWLLVDDADRARYAAAIAAVESRGWVRSDWVAFAPAKPTLAYTAVLMKPRLDG